MSKILATAFLLVYYKILQIPGNRALSPIIQFIFMNSSNQAGFQTFSFVHLATVAVIIFVAFFLAFIVRTKKFKALRLPISRLLFTIQIANELIFLFIIISIGVWDYKWGLPIQICDLAVFAVAFSLLKHNQFVWELAYFWGLGGTVQAILSPDIQFTFPDYAYIKFFLTHGCIIIGVIYLSVGCGGKIYKSSLLRVFVTTNIYSFAILIFNRLLDTNYLYLCEKPSQPSILDYLGPWPTYLLWLEVILIVSLLFYYLPFYIAEKVNE